MNLLYSFLGPYCFFEVPTYLLKWRQLWTPLEERVVGGPAMILMEVDNYNHRVCSMHTNAAQHVRTAKLDWSFVQAFCLGLLGNRTLPDLTYPYHVKAHFEQDSTTTQQRPFECSDQTRDLWIPSQPQLNKVSILESLDVLRHDLWGSVLIWKTMSNPVQGLLPGHFPMTPRKFPKQASWKVTLPLSKVLSWELPGKDNNVSGRRWRTRANKWSNMSNRQLCKVCKRSLPYGYIQF